MIDVRRAAERGHGAHGWLDTWHTFSFADYHDPAWTQFRTLRVLNDDTVAPGAGFPTHGHRDMEIVSYVLDGALQHRDSMGTGSVIRPGDVQRMSAGTGVLHSEFNAAPDAGLHFLQIWILPERAGLSPGYEQRAFPVEERRGGWRVVASRGGRDGSLTIHQDTDIHATVLAAGEAAEHTFAPGRYGYLHVARGTVRLGDRTLQAGDGARIEGEGALRVEGVEDAEALLFDMP